VCRTIGPGELLDHDGHIDAVVMEAGAVGSHAAIVARALAIPMVVGADLIVAEAQNGDQIIVDGDRGAAFLRPPVNLLEAYREKTATAAAAESRYQAIRNQPAETRDGVGVELHINAGLLSDMPNLLDVGAAGV